MKVRNGKLKLDPNEKRIGNFVIKSDGDYMKVCDINKVYIYSASASVPAGMFLKQAYDNLSDEGTGKGLGNYIAVLWTFLSTIPDIDFMTGVYKLCEECMNRHPEAYGYLDKNMTEDGDADVIQEMREMQQFEEDVKNLPEDETGADTL